MIIITFSHSCKKKNSDLNLFLSWRCEQAESCLPIKYINNILISFPELPKQGTGKIYLNYKN